MSRSTFNQEKSNVVVGFFCGTGAIYGGGENGERVKSPPSANKELDNMRINNGLFSELTDCLKTENENQEIYGYDGCHLRGGGLFARGIEEPSDDLYQKIKVNINKNSDEKLKVILIGHSRGCLSALLLAKKINADKELNSKVDVILDLRDPVPGNFNLSSKADVGNIATISSQLFDLQDCSSIKKSYLTIQEKGAIDIGFDVLIPKFHASTKLDIEYLPGSHNIQNSIDKYLSIKDHVIHGHPIISLVGFLKSLQILLENGADINFIITTNKIIRYLEELSKTEEGKKNGTYELTMKKTYRDAYQEILKEFNCGLERGEMMSKDFYCKLLNHSQVILYNTLLTEFKDNKAYKIHDRELHFGGKFSVTAPDTEQANCLNMRHASLLPENKDPAYYPKSLLGFNKPSERGDLNNARFINIPDNPFQQRYQRIMLVLDQQIKSTLIIPNSDPREKFIDRIKKDLSENANNSSLSNIDKNLEMEKYLLNMYLIVRKNEGWFANPLRTGLEWIMNSDGLLGIKKRYGISFPENADKMFSDLQDQTTKLFNMINLYKKSAVNNPDLYDYGIKFLIQLDEVKTKEKKEVNELSLKIKALLEQEESATDAPVSDTQSNLFEKFKAILFNTVDEIRKGERNNSFFHKSSYLIDFIEKFLNDEFKLTVSNEETAQLVPLQKRE